MLALPFYTPFSSLVGACNMISLIEFFFNFLRFSNFELQVYKYFDRFLYDDVYIFIVLMVRLL